MNNKYLLSEIKLSLTGTFLLSSFIFVLANPKLCSEGVLEGIKLAGGFLVPSLYFQIIISNMIFSSGFLSRIPFINRKREIIILGLIGGYTVGSVLTSRALEEGSISEKDAKALGYSFLCGGPAFIIGGIGYKLLTNVWVGVIIYLSSALSQLIIYFLQKKDKEHSRTATSRMSFSEALVSSVNRSTASIISLSGFVVLFSAMSYIFINSSSIQGKAFGCDISRLISYFFEATFAGTDIVNTRANNAAELITFFVTFGGLSLHMQVFSFLNKLKLNFFKFFILKLSASFLSVIVCSMLLKLFPVSVETLSSGTAVSAVYANIPASFFLIIFSAYLLFKSGKFSLKRKSFH